MRTITLNNDVIIFTKRYVRKHFKSNKWAAYINMIGRLAPIIMNENDFYYLYKLETP